MRDSFFFSSRGATIITQKENKGEYHGIQCEDDTCAGRNIDDTRTWYWDNSDYDWGIYAHAFDQNGPKDGNEVPYQYSTTISDWGISNSQYYYYPDVILRCTTATATGETLYSGTRIPSTDKACVANTHNAGNWYNYPATTAGLDNRITAANFEAPNSICPKGWRLPLSSGDKSYYNLIHDKYNITATDSDATLLDNSAMSFIRLGNYYSAYGSVSSRGYVGHYWSSISSSILGTRHLYFGSKTLQLQVGANKSYGFPIRCVSR